MKEFSLGNADFKKISLGQIKALFEAVKTSSGDDISYLKERYSRSARFFDETLIFMSLLRIVENMDGRIQLCDSSQTGIEALLLSSLFGKSNKIQAIEDYLNNFSQTQGVYSFKPSVQLNLQTSGIRNLLLELDFLAYDPDNGAYTVSEKGVPYLLSFLRRTSSRQLEIILRQRDKIGLQAEIQVLAYERKRLKKFPDLVKRIKHVSRTDVGAGYDIRSYILNASGSSTFKYIEVKAVSENSFGFFWSRNEVDVAKTYGERYFLYLLPVTKRGKLDIKKLKMIQDPYVKIYTNKKSYDLTCELYHVSPKSLEQPR